GRVGFIDRYGDDEPSSGAYEDHGYRATRSARPSRSAQETLAASRLSTGGLRGGVGNRAILTLNVGDRVSHDGWGLGTVVDTRGSGEQAQAQVDFGSAGVKWLLVGSCKAGKILG